MAHPSRVRTSGGTLNRIRANMSEPMKVEPVQPTTDALNKLTEENRRLKAEVLEARLDGAKSFKDTLKAGLALGLNDKIEIIFKLWARRSDV